MPGGTDKQLMELLDLAQSKGYNLSLRRSCATM
jgi:hypothetical protein